MILGLAAQDAMGQTASNLYVRVDGGGSFPTGSFAGGFLASGVDLSSFDPSGVVGAGLGFRFLPFLRTDVTVSYRPSYSGNTTNLTTGFLTSGEVKNLSGFLNAYVDIPTPTPFTPYVGAGIGAARNQTGTTSVTNGFSTLSVQGSTKTSFAYQAMGGVSFPIFIGVALDLGYHYINGGRFKTSTNATLNGLTVPGGVSAASGKLKAHEVQLGLRVGF